MDERPEDRPQGVAAGVGGMVLAVGGTMLRHEIESYEWILVAMVLSTIAGVPLSRSRSPRCRNGRRCRTRSAGSAGLVGTAKYFLWAGTAEMTPFRMGAITFEVILGYLACTGSLMAAGKLQEVLPTRPITYRARTSSTWHCWSRVGIGGLLVYVPTRPSCSR